MQSNALNIKLFRVWFQSLGPRPLSNKVKCVHHSKKIWKEFILLSSANSKYKLFKLLLNAITPPVKSNQ